MTAATSDETRAQIVRDYQSGMLQREVAMKHGLGPATVHRVLKSAGAERGRKFATHILDEAIQDYLDSGDSMRAVSRRHPLSEDTLRLELRKRDLSRPNGSTIPEWVREAVIDDFLAGSTVPEAATKYGVARSTIAAWLAKAGVGAEDRNGESPVNYEGGWVRRGLVMVPIKPVRNQAA